MRVALIFYGVTLMLRLMAWLHPEFRKRLAERDLAGHIEAR